MDSQTFNLGDIVQRVAKDYTGGRTGNVIEIKNGRARVHWIAERGGQYMNRKTWVRFQDLKPAFPNLST